MSSSALADLSSLLTLSHERNLDLRPVLLRVQTDLFASAPSRDRETIEAFEALALGFIPVVDDETAAIVARKLAPLADAPPRVIEALLARGGGIRRAVLAGMPRLSRAVAAAVVADDPDLAPALAVRPDLDEATVVELLGQGSDHVDIALAGNRSAVLGRALHQLVERGRERPLLAAALLAREDLSVFDEAVLYVHADTPRRAQIRYRLEAQAALGASSGPASLPRIGEAARGALLACAKAGDGPGFQAALAAALGVGPASAGAWRFDGEARQELVALALVAAGVAGEDAIRIFLTLDRAAARSARTVFHLAEIARKTPRAVALYLTEAAAGTAVARGPARQGTPTDSSAAPDRPQAMARPSPARAPATPSRREFRAG